MNIFNNNKYISSFTALFASLNSNLILFSVILAASVWVIEPSIDYLFLEQRTFYQLLTHPNSHDALMRSVVSILIVIMGISFSFLIRHSMKTNEYLQPDKINFRDIYEVSPNALILSNKQGEIMLINRSASIIFGYEDSELITKSIEELIPERFRMNHPRLRQDFIKSSSNQRQMGVGQELCGLHKDGTEFPIEIGLTNFMFGPEIMVLSTITNVSKRKELESQLKESEERLSLAMKGANDGLWDWNLLNDEVHYSPRWKSMLGYTENEIEDHLSAWKRLLHPDDLDNAIANANAFISNNTDKYEFEFRMQHKDGHYIHILSRAFAVEDEAGKITRLVGTHIDITERKKSAEQLSYQSSHDALTGLVNRREFERRTERLLSTSTGDSQHALCYMDLDQFKVVNDTCGHAAGDEMLRQLGSLLQKVVRHRDTIARLGGDEFGVLMEHCSLDDAHRVTNSIKTVIQDYQFLWEGRSFKVSVSIGLVPIIDTTLNLTELLKNADTACYMAKDKGRNRIHVHRDEDTELAQRQGEMQWVSRIQQGLDEDRFCLYAQAIEPLDGHTGVHYELLIRMVDEQGTIIPPGAFLPPAERYNIMAQLDKWVIQNAINLLTNNPAFLEQINFISINLSGQSLNDEDFFDFVIKQLQMLGKNNTKICFEITETAAISNLLIANKFIAQLKQFGCRFALDDFGSGLSSFGYLKTLPVDYLKIDGMFVKNMVDDQIDCAMVKSINEIGHVMGMQTIAEFVENDEIKGMLREIGVNYAQGYGIHKPQPIEEILG